jgi:hypothetical protein
VIPQEDPRSYIKLFKSFNVPEFTKDKVPYLPEQFEKVVKGPHTPVKYKEIRPRFRNINNEK